MTGASTRYDLGTWLPADQRHRPGEMRQTPWGPLQWLAPGVLGVTRVEGTDIVLYWVESSEAGAGNVSRYFDALPRDRRVVATAVMSPVIVAMLRRRGFRQMPDSDDWERDA